MGKDLYCGGGAIIRRTWAGWEEVVDGGKDVRPMRFICETGKIEGNGRFSIFPPKGVGHSILIWRREGGEGGTDVDV